MRDVATLTEPEALSDLLAEARLRTLELIDLVEDDDLNRSLNPEFSPLRWHLGHIASYEAFWVLSRADGRSSPEPTYDRLFDPRVNPKTNRVHLPSRAELLGYAEQVRDAVLEVLTRASPDHPNPLLRDGYVGWLVYEHERQHQEIMSVLLQMLPHERTRRPDGWHPQQAGTEPPDTMVNVPAGSFIQGANGRGFAYDNERTPHNVHLDAFHIARAPVTELAYLRFIEEGGYRVEQLWSADGWSWRVANDINAPRGWSRSASGGWMVRAVVRQSPTPGRTPGRRRLPARGGGLRALGGTPTADRVRVGARRDLGCLARPCPPLPLGRRSADVRAGEHRRSRLGNPTRQRCRP